MTLPDSKVEQLVADWIYADKVGDTASRLQIEDELERAGIGIVPDDAGVTWYRREMVS